MAVVQNLFDELGTKWAPDADAVNAPEQVLLRADNLVPDKIGTLSLRRGSEITYSSMDGGASDNVHSLHTVELANGTTYRSAGVGNNLYINGSNYGEFGGSGDIAMGDDSYQTFYARGTTKKKWDGTNFHNWGIERPSAPPTLAAVNSVTSSVATFASGESPAVTAPEGSGLIGTEADQAGAANQASRLTPDGSTFRGVLQKLWTTDQDYFRISGVTGTETDQFDLFLKFENPRNVETVKIVFGAGNSSTDPFQTDRFEHEFDLRNRTVIPNKDIESEGYSAFEAAVLSSLSSVRPQDVTGIKTPEQVKAILASVGKIPSSTTSLPTDAATWGHLTITRGQFKRVGNTDNRGWDTIRGFKIIYTTRQGTVSYATFSDAIFVGGGARTLTGTYRCVIRAARNFGQYYELSPPSEQSEPVNLNHQTPQITIPATVLSSLDPQVDEIWVYLFGGWLPAYYRFAVVSATVRSGMVIDEWGPPAGSDFDSADERARITSWGFTLGADNGSSDIILTLLRSEMDALTEDEKLEPFLMVPPDNIVAIAGPHHGRMFVLTSDGYVYPSTLRSPSTFNSVQVIDLTRYGNPLWMVKTGQGIVVGMEKDVVFLAGTGDEQESGLIDLYAQPLNLGNPPIDSSRWVDGNTIVYRSADGLMFLTGSNMSPVPMAGTSLLWRGINRHGIQGLNVTSGRFRIAVDDAMIYVLAPENPATSTNVIYRYATQSQQWSRLVYGEVSAFHSIFKEPNGTLIAGDNAGRLWTLDTGTQDNLNNIDVRILTPIRNGGNPLARKDAFDLQIHCTTGGSLANIALYRDGDSDDSSDYDFSTNVNQVYRINASDFGTFLKAQMDITGSFSQFSLQHVNLTFRARPQHTMHLDTGYLSPDGNGDLTWLYEVEIDANAANDMVLKVYLNDVLRYEADVPVTANIRKPYIVPIPRGTKGYRPRIIVESAADNAAGHIGFECYGIRVRMGSSGNQDGAVYRSVYPVGNAP